MDRLGRTRKDHVYMAERLEAAGVRDLVEEFDAKPAEIKALFSNSLEPVRAATLRDRMLAAGLPI